MNEKILKSRIIHKHDVEANWLLATNFMPLKGEMIIYDIDENYSYERIKIGDGVTNVNALPFVTDGFATEEYVDAKIASINKGTIAATIVDNVLVVTKN